MSAGVFHAARLVSANHARSDVSACGCFAQKSRNVLMAITRMAALYHAPDLGATSATSSWQNGELAGEFLRCTAQFGAGCQIILHRFFKRCVQLLHVVGMEANHINNSRNMSDEAGVLELFAHRPAFLDIRWIEALISGVLGHQQTGGKNADWQAYISTTQ